MSRLTGVRRYVRVPHNAVRQIEREIDDELRFHLDMRAQELRDAGVPSPRAEEEARRRFGDLSAGPDCREQDRHREGAVELVVRMAVGATASDVFRMLLGDVGRVVALGLAIGTVAALGLGRALSSQLFAIRAADPWTYGVVTFVLAGAAFVATGLPGLRATRIDPASVLRDG